MAKRSFKVATFTSAAVADTVAFAASSYMALQGGSATQRILVSEIFLGGQAGSSAPQYVNVSRDSTVGVTPTALSTGSSDAALDPATAALAAPAVPFVTAGTQPQRSATLGLLNLSFNAFGGLVRWVAYPGEELVLLGNTASFGELSVSFYTGTTGALVGGHLVYEPL